MKICSHTKFRWDISIHGWDKTTSRFGKWTADILEFCFLFRFWPIYSHRQVILYQPVKFRHNGTIGGEVMTWYGFFKMAVIESEIYFRFLFWWWYSFGKMEIYWNTKFWWDTSIHGWDKTTSDFGKRTAAIFDFYFRFLFLSACHSLAYQISSKSNNPWRSYNVISIFSRWRPAALLDLIWITLDQPQSVIVGLRLVLKFVLDRIDSFGDIIFIFCRFGLKLPIHANFCGVLGAYFPDDVTHHPNPQKALLYAETRRLSHKAWKSRFTVERPIQKSIVKWEIRPTVKS